MACMTCIRCHNSNNNFIDCCTYCGSRSIIYDDEGLDYEGETCTDNAIQAKSTETDSGNAQTTGLSKRTDNQ